MVNRTDEFNGWDEWKSLNKRGMDCLLKIRKKGNKITVITENGGIAITSHTTINDDVKDVYLALTGDQCAITNIRARYR